MRNRTMTDTCSITGGKHDLTLARQRGSRDRHRCTSCGLMTGWTKREDADLPAWDTPNTPVDDTVAATFWNGATVADLKQMCKDKGITGYSKMKRDDLLSVLGAV